MARRTKWTDDDLRIAVAESQSVAEVLRKLGYKPSGGVQRYVNAWIRLLDLSTEHFTGSAWARGRRFPSRGARPLEDLLIENSPAVSTSKLKARLFAAGLKEKRCEECGIDSWRGQPITLMLDHINGINNDNRLENLRILCPNCHALTDTWCGRNRLRREGSAGAGDRT
jgi:hypothetical protein